MKNILYSFFLLLTIGVNAQIGIGKAKPDPTAIIDLSSTKKGFLLPRMTTAQRETIAILPAKPATGLQVYDTDTNSLWYFNGTDWVNTTITDASATAKGILKLAGDLSGSADAPIVGVDKINSAKILDNTITNNDLSNGTGGIYKGSGSLSANTTVTGGATTLAFTSTKTNGFSVDGPTFSIDAANDAVGIGTAAPDSKAILDLTSTTKGILPPRMTTVQRDAITTPPTGLTIYNTSTNSLEVFNGTVWYSTLKTTVPGTITALNCASATLTTPLVKSVAATGITLTIPYTGGDAGTFDTQIIPSTGITGLTATLAKGNFATGAGTLGFALTGTPSNSGTASFGFNLGGQSCILNLTVHGVISGLTCGSITHNGSLANGSEATGVSSTIPYTGGDAGPFSAQSIPSTGVTGLYATLPAGNFLSGAGNLTYTITGTPAGPGTASFAITIGGKSCTLTRAVTGSLTTLDCDGATHNGTLDNGVAASGVNTIISYTGGDGSPYAVQNINSTGVTGLIAQLPAGNLATGNGTLTYTISGTPSGGGTASFAITIGGKSCSFSRTVIPMPATITLSDSGYFITSVLDSDYLPYSTSSVAATTATSVSADSSPDLTLDLQGTLNSTGVSVRIPYTVVTQATSIPAYSQTISIPATLTQDGNARDVILFYNSQTNLAVGTGFINAYLRTTGGILNVKKLDVQTGIGNDNLGLLLARFTYPKNSSGSTSNFDLRAIAPIPDRNSADSDHRFYYSPVYATDGKVWLANNLGADYANRNHAQFNPAKQAAAFAEFNAYGSLYQWGRYSDGHELINWTNATTGAAKYGTTTTQSPSSTATDKLFVISNSGSPYDWLATKNDALWQGASGTNNPCPLGYRVPTTNELTAVVNAEKIIDGSSSISSNLKFTSTGRRVWFTPGNVEGGNSVRIWSSTVVTSGYSEARGFSTFNTFLDQSITRSFGYSVRCIKD